MRVVKSLKILFSILNYFLKFLIIGGKEKNMPEAEIRYFTPSEANKTLPLVKQIVQDILNSTFRIKTIAEEKEGYIEDNQEVKGLIEKIDSYLNELNILGCAYKDWNFQFGLVDFPGIINGEEVNLCWRSDEDSIKYYHGIEEGYAGRKPIPADQL